MSGQSDAGAAATLVCDLGTTSSSAAVVTDDRSMLVPDPVTGTASWPSAVFWDGQQLLVGAQAERRRRAEPDAYAAEFKPGLAADVSVLLGQRRFRPVEQVVAMLSALRTEAEHLHGGPIPRVVLTVPAGYPPDDHRRTRLVAAGEAAGFEAVELLTEPVAAVSAPVAGPPFRPGDQVLVYDLGGGTFDAGLVRIGERWHELLGHATLDDCGGRDIDALLAGRIRAESQQWLPPPATAEAAQRLDMAVTEFARRIKHQLSDVPAVEDFLMPNAPPARLSRAELAALAAPLLDRTMTCCAELLTRLGVPAHDLAAVLMVGGAARMPAVAETLSTLGAPLRPVAAPELATVLGAAQWLPGSGPRRVSARTSPEPVVPLSFAIPGGAARLLHWLVLPGEAYLAGVPLARVRLPSGALWDLVAATPGTLDRLLVPPGADVAAHEWLALSRP